MVSPAVRYHRISEYNIAKVLNLLEQTWPLRQEHVLPDSWYVRCLEDTACVEKMLTADSTLTKFTAQAILCVCLQGVKC